MNNFHDKHFFLNASSDIDQLLTPLKKFGVHLFTFLRNYIDGAQIYLSNDAEWTKDYYKHNLFEHSLFESHPKNYGNGFVCWPKDRDSKVFNHGKIYFDSSYGITYIEKHTNYCNFYFFSGSNEYYLQNFFLNHHDLLLRFILYFKDSGELLLKKAEKYKIYIQKHYQITENNFHTNQDMFLQLRSDNLAKKEFCEHTKVRRCFINTDTNSVVKLSIRQVEFLKEIFKYKTIVETALALNISPRTAETYFTNIKIKLNCSKKLEIINKLKESGVHLNHLLLEE